MGEIFELQSAAVGPEARLVGFRGSEAVSDVYRYDLYATVPIDAVPAAADVVGTTASLVIQPDDGEADQIHGVVATYRVIDVTADRALVALVLVPRLHHLSQSIHSRVFTGLSPVEIITEVLEAAGLSDGTDFSFDLHAEPAALDHVCQYKESDLDFVSRWMEREGMVYTFDHSGDIDKLVISDHNSAFADGPDRAVRYIPTADASAHPSVGTFDRFSSLRTVQPEKVRFSDYDYTHPAAEVSGEATAGDTTSAQAVTHGVPTTKSADAKRLATVVAEAHACSERVFKSRGPVFRLHAGRGYELAEHPRGDFDREYVCIRADIRGALHATTPALRKRIGLEGDEVYQVQATAVDRALPYRLLPRTPVPRIAGLERALVDGPADSDYAQIDDQGRYHVKLALDETDREGEAASMWVRMMQPHAGNPEGWHLPLRKGTEVMLAFVDGHPDRPLIAAAVPNAETPSPVTSANNTHNIFISGGENILEIEDQDGHQWCDWRSPTQETYLHLGKPHDPTQLGSPEKHTHFIVGNTNADCLFSIGTNQDIRVGGKLTEEVKGDVGETYHTSQTSKITGTQSTTVTNAVTETYTGGHKTEVTGKVTELYGAAQKTTVTGDRFEFYNAEQTTMVGGAVTQNFNAGHNLAVIGPSSQLHHATKYTKATAAAAYRFDSDVSLIFGQVDEKHAETDWTMGPATLHAGSVTYVAGEHHDQNAVLHRLEAVISEFYLNFTRLAPILAESFQNNININGFQLDVMGVVQEIIQIDIAGAAVNTLSAGAHSTTAGVTGHG